MAWRAVAPVSALEPDDRVRVVVDGRAVAIFRVNGALHAIADRCPHQGASLCAGLVTIAVASAMPGVYERRPEDVSVRCPWHGWEFDLTTGRALCDPGRVRARPYPVATGGPAAPPDATVFPVDARGEWLLLDV